MGHGEDEQYSEDETQRRFEALVKAQHAARTQEGSSEGARRVKARRQARKEKGRLTPPRFSGGKCSRRASSPYASARLALDRLGLEQPGQ
jgi:hypothetical protein